MKISGLHVNYYFVCKRKLWCQTHYLRFEEGNDSVVQGKILDEQSYNREAKHVVIDETIAIDFIQKWKILHEVKKSKAVEEASIWQVKYYLYYLEQKGVSMEKGILDYPKLKSRESVYLTKEDHDSLKKIL